MYVYSVMEEVNGRKAYEKLQKLLLEKKDKLRVMERQIDIDLQMAYFKKASDIKEKLPPLEQIINDSDKLFTPDFDIETKRNLLNQLASYEDVKCFRILEKYMKEPDATLANWSYLAYQESLMTMESSLSEEDTVYISSGLGGKGAKLRYFVVMMSQGRILPFDDSEKQLILKEIDYLFNRNSVEIEKCDFNDVYCSYTCLIPIDVSIAELFEQLIVNVNEFKNILSDNFLITNVRKMNMEEVVDFIEKKLEGKDNEDE